MKKIVFIILVAALIIPFIQEQFKIIQLKPLSGVVIESSKVPFSINSWLDGTFQIEFESQIDKNFGLRNFFIRVFNQFDYSAFRKAHAYVVIGKKHFLYEQNYIDEFTGKNFIGEDSMEIVVKNLKSLQDSLDIKNVLLLTVLAPGKTDYYNEYLPKNHIISSERNYTSLLNNAKKKNIRLIDVNGWFLKLKDTTRYPLFSNQGIHWNFYGMALVADSIRNFIEVNQEISLPELSWYLELPDTLRGTDYDLGNLLNLYLKLPYKKMPYPRFSIKYSPTDSRPRMLVIADSFYWTIFNEGIFRNTFTNETYYYYNKTIFPEDQALSRFPEDLNMIKEVEKYDIIIFLQSSAQYQFPGLGFVEMLLNSYKKKEVYFSEAESMIEKNDSLKNTVLQIAKQRKISPDDSRKFMIDSLTEFKIEIIAKTKMSMRGVKEWMDQMYVKSLQQNKTLEEIMQIDAEWVFKNNYNY